MTATTTQRLLVIGEALLDVDVEGTTDRLSPDAPVPVLDDLVELPRPGGAALAAAMAAGDGAHVTLATSMADDAGGEALLAALGPSVTVLRLPHDGATPTKRRVRANGQTVVRLDSGGRSAAWSAVPADLRAALEAADAVLVSDYGRGLSDEPLLRALLEDRAGHTPLVWDPHRRGGDPVRGTYLFTPNEAELHARAGSVADGSQRFSRVADDAAALVERFGVRAVAATLGDRGALLSYGRGAPQAFSADRVRDADACGAGDRFAATAAVCTAAGQVLSESVQRAVHAATRHVAEGGAAGFGKRLHDVPSPPTDDTRGWDARRLAAEVRANGGTVVATGGCFDLLHAGHVASLEAARRLGDCLVVCLNSDASVRRLKGAGRPLVPAADRARVLMSLHCVDAVAVFDADTPGEVLRELRPHLWAKGGDYAGSILSEEAVLAEWGGQALVLPYLDGRSTTRLVDAMTSTPAVTTTAPRRRPT